MRHISKTTLVTILNAVVAVICLFAFLVGQANAVWYEATGQAVVRNGDKETARHAATQEALKQAMLFAGASVHSVAKLTNGLLKNEEMTIRSTGEVEQLELVDEVYSGDVITVSIRADIFPRGKVCAAQNDQKHFATTPSGGSLSRPGRTEPGFRPQIKVYGSEVFQNDSTRLLDVSR